jgi:3-oxoacyl-[acyl-carrier protein] reductase
MDTDRLRSNIETVAKTKKISIEQARAERIATMPAGRFGTGDEFGAACAWLCSQQAGYITGQNWLVDGGAYPGTF